MHSHVNHEFTIFVQLRWYRGYITHTLSLSLSLFLFFSQIINTAINLKKTKSVCWNLDEATQERCLEAFFRETKYSCDPLKKRNSPNSRSVDPSIAIHICANTSSVHAQRHGRGRGAKFEILLDAIRQATH